MLEILKLTTLKTFWSLAIFYDSWKAVLQGRAQSLHSEPSAKTLRFCRCPSLTWCKIPDSAESTKKKKKLSSCAQESQFQLKLVKWLFFFPSWSSRWSPHTSHIYFFSFFFFFPFWRRWEEHGGWSVICLFVLISHPTWISATFQKSAKDRIAQGGWEHCQCSTDGSQVTWGVRAILTSTNCSDYICSPQNFV